MTLETKITRDLKAGQATLHNLAKNTNSTIAAVTVTLVRMAKNRKVYTEQLADGLTVWKLNFDN